MTGSPNGQGPSSGSSRGQPRSDLPSISLILGAVSIPAVALFVVGGAVAGCAAIVVGRRALAQVRNGTAEGANLAVAGIVAGSAGLVLSIGAGVFFLFGGL